MRGAARLPGALPPPLRPAGGRPMQELQRLNARPPAPPAVCEHYLGDLAAWSAAQASGRAPLSPARSLALLKRPSWPPARSPGLPCRPGSAQPPARCWWARPGPRALPRPHTSLHRASRVCVTPQEVRITGCWAGGTAQFGPGAGVGPADAAAAAACSRSPPPPTPTCSPPRPDPRRCSRGGRERRHQHAQAQPDGASPGAAAARARHQVRRDGQTSGRAARPCALSGPARHVRLPGLRPPATDHRPCSLPLPQQERR